MDDIHYEPIPEKHIPTFDEWHEVKKNLHNKKIEEIPYFYEREIWWCCLGRNIGWEQDGKNGMYSRPVVVLKIFRRELFWALPLTTKNKGGGKYYHQYELDGIKYTAILSQLRALSSNRLIRKIGMLGEDDFNKMKGRTKHLLS